MQAQRTSGLMGHTAAWPVSDQRQVWAVRSAISSIKKLKVRLGGIFPPYVPFEIQTFRFGASQPTPQRAGHRHLPDYCALGTAGMQKQRGVEPNA